MSGELAFVTAFIAGLASFFSPCVFPLLPVFISIIAPNKNTQGTAKTFRSAMFFVLGFSFVFIALGMTASFIGSVLMNYIDAFRKIGAVLMVLMGFFMIGIIPLDFLSRDWRPMMENNSYYEKSAFFLGMAFVFGLMPCTGPVLASILMYAGMKQSLWYGFYLLLIYSIGFSIPLLIVALVADSTASALRGKILPYLGKIQKVSGFILVLFGILLYFDMITKFVNALY